MQQTPFTISEDFAEDILDKILALRDVLQASSLLQDLVDPVMRADALPMLPDVDRAGLASMLRIVNRDFAMWLSALESVLEKAGVAVPQPV